MNQSYFNIVVREDSFLVLMCELIQNLSAINDHLRRRILLCFY